MPKVPRRNYFTSVRSLLTIPQRQRSNFRVNTFPTQRGLHNSFTRLMCCFYKWEHAFVVFVVYFCFFIHTTLPATSFVFSRWSVRQCVCGLGEGSGYVLDLPSFSWLASGKREESMRDYLLDSPVGERDFSSLPCAAVRQNNPGEILLSLSSHVLRKALITFLKTTRTRAKPV